jgi:hypothetical protein
MPDITGAGADGRARENAENYLGRPITDQEYNYLIRATHAEAAAGKSADPREQAMVMASILNRARTLGEDGIIKALTAKNQFQAVTGTKYNPGPSANFVQGPGDQRAQSIADSTSLLSSIPHEQKNFTAANAAAYGPGTNIGYRNNMIAQGGTVVGGSVFNTNPDFSNPASSGDHRISSPAAQSLCWCGCHVSQIVTLERIRISRLLAV